MTTKEAPKHTATPWQARVAEDFAWAACDGVRMCEISADEVAEDETERLSTEARERIHLIVRAVNAHAALVEALRETLDFAHFAHGYNPATGPRPLTYQCDRPVCIKARAALALAGEE